jgi:glutathionyl-hydroquinone reductase
MGMLIEGAWCEAAEDPRLQGGHFVRQDTTFRHRITPKGRFPARAGRYHLFASWSCPWSHRTMLARAIKGLGEVVPMTVASGPRIEGYPAGSGGDQALPGLGRSVRHLHEVYTAAKSDYTGRVTIPVLWDGETATIVNNESSDILAIFNEGFGDLADGPDLYPEALRDEIDFVNAKIYHSLSNAVYEAGYTDRQSIHEDSIELVFQTLDWLDARLVSRPFVAGHVLTEADLRLFPTLFRFSAIYAVLFKCNLRPLSSYPALVAYMKRIVAIPGVEGTMNLAMAKKGYFHDPRLNPTGVVPLGPLVPEWQS